MPADAFPARLSSSNARGILSGFVGRIALTIGLALAAGCTFGTADNKRASTTNLGDGDGDGDGTTSVADTSNALTGLPLDTGEGDGTTVAVSATGSGSDGSDTTGPNDFTTGDATSSGSSSSGGEPFVLCDDADPDLHACYDFANVDGGTLTDHSMYENHGTVSAVQVEPGPFEGALRFSEDAEVAIPDSPSLDLPGPLSFEAWVYVDSLPDEDRVGIVDNDAQYSAMLYAGEGIRCHGGNAQASTAAFPIADWFHIACVHDGRGIEVWIDGQLEASGAGGDPIATRSAAPVAIGDSSPGYDVPLDGLVGAVRIWSSVRTEEELEAAANAGQ